MKEILAIIIPSYNEKKTMRELLLSIRHEQKNACIVVVDDSSPDGTAEIVKSLQKNDKKIFLLQRDKKSGRGAAVLYGMLYALNKLHASIFVEMDADLLHNPKDIKRLVEKINEKTLVIGSRYIKNGKALQISPRRKIMSFLANEMIKFVLKLPITDNTNGFRCYPATAVKLLSKHTFISSGYIALSESSYLLSKHGFSFVEVPIICINRKDKKSNASLHEFIHALKALLKIRKIN